MQLKNVNVVVTRAAHQSGGLSKRLQDLGATVFEVPTIQIVPPTSWQEIDRAIAQIEKYDWMIFASVNAVESFVARWADRTKTRLFTGKVAAIGPTTAEVLRVHKLEVNYEPDKSVAEDFVKQFPGYPNLIGKKILWPRTNIGRDLIADKLRGAGADLDVAECYRTVLPSGTESGITTLHKMLADRTLDIITVASSQSVRNLACLLKQSTVTEPSDAPAIRQMLHNTAIISIGPETTATAVQYLGKCEGQAEHYDIDGLVEAILEYVRQSE